MLPGTSLPSLSPIVPFHFCAGCVTGGKDPGSPTTAQSRGAQRIWCPRERGPKQVLPSLLLTHVLAQAPANGWPTGGASHWRLLAMAGPRPPGHVVRGARTAPGPKGVGEPEPLPHSQGACSRPRQPGRRPGWAPASGSDAVLITAMLTLPVIAAHTLTSHSAS